MKWLSEGSFENTTEPTFAWSGATVHRQLPSIVDAHTTNEIDIDGDSELDSLPDQADPADDLLDTLNPADFDDVDFNDGSTMDPSGAETHGVASTVAPLHTSLNASPPAHLISVGSDSSSRIQR